MDFSAMLAYNILITLLPIAVALFGITGLVLKNYSDIQNEVKEKVIHFFPVDNTTQAGIKQLLVFFFALFGASRLFIAIDKCMTIVYRLPQRTFLRQNLLAFGMLFLFITIIPIMLAASSAPAALISIIPGGGGRFGTFLARMMFSLLVGFIFFESIYWFVPNKKMSFKVTWCEAFVAACTLDIFIISFPLYAQRFMGNYAVEGLGTYISQMHQEHGVGEPTRPLCENETDEQQHQSTTDESLHGKRWLKKLWPSKITSSAEHGGEL
ncbi:unnamed protein product [Rotaria sordida]|uniref:Uncharacterized protein n=1 Tax=Rotaria sordida TaxID=392033 RepID=A0A813ZNG7_9BILA|nr:unnamed protein product [Rotaria sordida]